MSIPLVMGVNAVHQLSLPVIVTFLKDTVSVRRASQVRFWITSQPQRSHVLCRPRAERNLEHASNISHFTVLCYWSTTTFHTMSYNASDAALDLSFHTQWDARTYLYPSEYQWRDQHVDWHRHLLSRWHHHCTENSTPGEAFYALKSFPLRSSLSHNSRLLNIN